MHRSHADVVHLRLGARRVDLRGGVGGEADDALGPDELARLRHRHVVLADVDPVGVGLAHEVGAVVEDERHAAGGAHELVAPGHADDLAIAGVLEAQLDEIDAAAQRLLEERVGARVADEVEPGGVDGGAEVAARPSVCQDQRS